MEKREVMLEDQAIINLYWERDEEAIRESERKYGGLCRRVASNILTVWEDVEECLNDTWMGAWNSMPTERPQFLSAFLCRITKNLAWKRIDYNRAQKRSPEVLLSLEELGECVSGESSPEQQIEAKWLGKQISDFLWSCKQEERVIFLRRYWYFDSIAEIARQLQISESKVKSVLYRMRKRLQNYLRAEGAAGETQAELLKLLAVSDIKELSGQCGSLYSQLYENESDSQFRIANSLWIAARQSNGRKIHWQKDYLNTLVKDFYASLFLVDFQEANTYQYMTEWVSDQTGGLLTPDFNPAQQEIPQL